MKKLRRVKSIKVLVLEVNTIFTLPQKKKKEVH